MSNDTELNWFKSSYSSPQGDDCVEVATLPGAVHVRDSKDTTIPSLCITPTAWSAFIAHAGR
ncbi:DUF397 domain-containing protein [Streptomyces spirodelae]|uniref:DUF397 domain-containing protein n=1 Tax=Streptomyces spirodelae TaxID=2812904 RepID=A0ABS3X020_9ACTN|nr:DUF397 domain-containing protein [Streptomyces spirodelae]MBO8188679.1 DUF397 domain-containing protein [Streptomyces spirodelae]